MLDLSRLTSRQRDAVLAGDGPLLIVAGPGSGKTTVLAARIAHLVTGRQISPTSVLAVTFTTRAGRELRTRLGQMLGDLDGGVDVMTFHAFGLRLIRHWSEELGLGPGPVAVYGDDDALAVVQEVAMEMAVDLDRHPLGELAAALQRFRLSGEAPAELFFQMAPLAEAFEARLKRRSAVDYAGMLVLPLRLFAERPAALQLVQDTYRHVVVDEFQDVNAPQYTLVRHLAERHRNLVVVGDPCQTLYGWRGADARFLLDFQQDFPETRVINLDQNFRSTERIVDLANVLGAPLPYRHPLWTDNPTGDDAFVYLAGDESEEAGFVAAEIARLLRVGAIGHAGEVAVLYRTNSQAYHLALTLRLHNLPYRVRGHGDLFGRREIRDAVAYLRLAHNPGDVRALGRIVNVPPRRLARLADALRAQPAAVSEITHLAAAYGRTAAANAEALQSLISILHAESDRRGPASLLDLALDRSGYRVWLAGQSDGPDRIHSLDTLRALAAEAEGDLGTWLADLQLAEDVPSASDDGDRVVLTTIHGAKGSEWRVVFVVGMEEGLLPHSRSLRLSTAEPRGLEDELRVAYVAVTRPRERLYLTLCRTRRLGDRSVERTASRFLHGLPLARIGDAA